MLFLPVIAVLAISGPGVVQPPPAIHTAISANDNRIPAGTIVRGVLHLSIDARWGEWHPDGGARPGVPMQAFGETGKPLQIPGPLIRVPVGTEEDLRIQHLVPATERTVRGLIESP